MLTCPILVTYASKTAMEEKTQTIFIKPSMKREKSKRNYCKANPKNNNNKNKTVE